MSRPKGSKNNKKQKYIVTITAEVDMIIPDGLDPHTYSQKQKRAFKALVEQGNLKNIQVKRYAW